ncbi:MAG: hypothetical protein HY841_02365 [Bacteroidetes bacterium]|nr:hypothetical protein [Bacteroidota bacterium]
MYPKKLKYDYLSGSAGKCKVYMGIRYKGISGSAVPYTLYLISLFLICCTPALIPPIETDVVVAKQKWSDASLSQLKEGYTLFKIKCSKCHYLYRPNKFSEEKWHKMIPIMGKKAKLDSLQTMLITKYILTAKETNSFTKK